MSQKDDRDLDAPTPPGGPLRRDEPETPTTETVSASEDRPTPPDLDVEPPGEHASELTSGEEQTESAQALQTENAETSADQPSH